MTVAATNPETPRWLHRCAVFTACATFVLLFAGSLVTTLHVGMADPVWPTVPWHLALVSWEWTEPRSRFLIEHAHRAVAYFVGACILGLAVALQFGRRRPLLRWLGAGVLAAVAAQGVLGGMRVLLNRTLGTDLAVLHGCFAQFVFALVVSLAVVTAPGWQNGLSTPAAPRLRRMALIALGLVYLQIVMGAVLRHTYLTNTIGPRGHLLFAFAVTAATVWIVKEVWEQHRGERALVRPATILAGLVCLQLLMGVEAWMIRFTETAAAQRIAIRTIHVLLGALILAFAVITALQTQRRQRLTLQTPESLEGAA